MKEQSIWKTLYRKWKKAHLTDSEFKIGKETVYFNPTVKLTVAWVVFILVVILAFMISNNVKKKSNEKHTDMNSKEEMSYTPFEKNQYPEINTFVENYLNALTNCDIATISSMVVDGSQYNADILAKRKEYITGYSNVVCYTKPGLDDNSYIVYAVVNTQIIGVDIQPLSLHQFYLTKNESGNWIHNNMIANNPEIEEYLNKIDRDEDVVKLYQTVDQNNTESAQSDESLKAFYEKIGVLVE